MELVDPQSGRDIAFAIIRDPVSVVIQLGAVGEFADITDAIIVAVGLIVVGEVDAVVELIRDAVSIGVDGGGAGSQRLAVDSKAR